MAILATRRKWLVTSRWAASRSPYSRQFLASMYSSCGSSMGNRRISLIYRARPDSAVRVGKAAAYDMTVPPGYNPLIGRHYMRGRSFACRVTPELILLLSDDHAVAQKFAAACFHVRCEAA